MSFVDRGKTRWIAFDAVGTLIYAEPSVSRVYWKIAARHGSRYSHDEIAERFAAAYREHTLDRPGTEADFHASELWQTSEETEREFWRFVVRDVIDDVDDHNGCFNELFEHFGRAASWHCFPDVAETLKTLSGLGIQLAVASNFDGRLHAICDGLPELQPISLRVVSSEAGHRKPSTAFYQQLLNAAGCEPGSLIMVGDDLRNDVQAAKAAGIEPIFLSRGTAERHARQIRSLRELLVQME